MSYDAHRPESRSARCSARSAPGAAPARAERCRAQLARHRAWRRLPERFCFHQRRRARHGQPDQPRRCSGTERGSSCGTARPATVNQPGLHDQILRDEQQVGLDRHAQRHALASTADQAPRAARWAASPALSGRSASWRNRKLLPRPASCQERRSPCCRWCTTAPLRAAPCGVKRLTTARSIRPIVAIILRRDCCGPRQTASPYARVTLPAGR